MGECDRLEGWWGLSYASFLTLPRVLIQEMPLEWQEQLAVLLEQYNDAFPYLPAVGSRVQITTLGGKLIATPSWLRNYRHPDRAIVEQLRKGPTWEPKT